MEMTSDLHTAKLRAIRQQIRLFEKLNPSWELKLIVKRKPKLDE